MSLDPKDSKNGKLNLGAVHPQFEESLAIVAETALAKGYEEFNWLKQDSATKFRSYLISAAKRHINKFLNGEDYNIEKDSNGNIVSDKGLHVEYAAYNLLMIATLFRQGRKDLDDRIKSSDEKNDIIMGYFQQWNNSDNINYCPDQAEDED